MGFNFHIIISRLLILFFFLCFSHESQSQLRRSDKYSSLGFHVSGFTYFGDLSPSSNALDQHLKTSRLGLGLELGKRINGRLSLIGNFSWGRLYGDDNAVSDENADPLDNHYVRNFHFRSDVFEFAMTGRIDILPELGHFSNRRFIRPYIFAGLALFYHNPQAKTSTQFGDTWIPLKPLGTEGQNFGLGNTYSRVQLAIPYGLGVNIKLTERLDLGFQIGYRRTFTDHLDDVSGDYVDLGLFGENALARKLSDRSLETAAVVTGNARDVSQFSIGQYIGMDGNTYRTAGGFQPGLSAQRGNPDTKDGYITTGVHLRFILSNTQKADELSRVHQIHHKPDVNHDRVIPDDFLKHRERYEVKALNVNTPYSEVPSSFYKEGILFDSDKPDNQNLVTRGTGGFYNIYYSPFADLLKDEITAPVIFPERSLRKYNFIQAVHIQNSDKVLLAMFEDLGRSKSKPHQGLYTAEVTGENLWTNVEEMPFDSEYYSVTQPTISRDGQTIYLVSDMPGGQGGTDIYVSYLHKGQWTIPKNLGPAINTRGDEAYPFIHDDGTLYFASDGHDGLGGFDIFEAIELEGEFIEVINLGAPINSKYNDFALILDDLKRVGYFSSNRQGGRGSNDIYMLGVKSLSSTRLLTADAEMIETKMVKINGVVRDSIGGFPIAGAFVKLNNLINNELSVVRSDESGKFSFEVSNDGEYEIGSSALSYRSMKMRRLQAIGKNYNLDKLDVSILMKPVGYRLYIKGKVMIEGVDAPLAQAVIRLIDVDTESEKTITTNVNGEYRFRLKRDKNYRLVVEETGYERKEYEFNTFNRISSETMLINFALPPKSK
ncbi:MAG: carboxypeptidase regulatory-like domain-containing protein [Flammeovirgaceae bacterium]